MKINHFAAWVAFGLLALPARAQVIFADNFESYPAGTTVLIPRWYAQQHCGTSPHPSCRSCVTASPQLVSSEQAYAGAHALKLTLSKDEQWYEQGSGLCKWRNELYNHNLFATGDEVWVGFSFYPAKVGGMVWQEMGPNGELWNSLVVHVSQILVNGASFATALDLAQIDATDDRYFVLNASGTAVAPVQWDQWNTIVLHFVVNGAQSQEEAWVNGTSSGLKPVSWPAGPSYDLKLGLYGDRPRDQFVAYFDSYQVARGAKQYAAVAPVRVAAGASAPAGAGRGPAVVVYPNPTPAASLRAAATGFGPAATYAISDATGRTVAAGAVNAGVVATSSCLPPGVYLLRATDGVVSKAQRFVVGN